MSLTLPTEPSACFFERFGIDIHSRKYQTNGTSRANKMRTFWSLEADDLVARVLAEMIDSHKAE